MSDKTLKILLGIIAVNLTLQTVKDVGLFPTAYAQLSPGYTEQQLEEIMELIANVQPLNNNGLTSFDVQFAAQQGAIIAIRQCLQDASVRNTIDLNC